MTQRGFLDLTGTPTLAAIGTNNLVVGTSGAADLVFVTNGVERLRIDSNGATTLTAAVDLTLANNDYLLARNAAGSGNLSLLKADASDNTVLNAATSKTHRFETAGTLQWSISSGNLTQDATAGGDIIMTSATKGIKIGAASMTSDVSGILGAGAPFFLQGAPASFHHIGMLANAATGDGSIVSFLKSRKTDGTADTIVQDGDVLGELKFYGADGASFQPAVAIRAGVDGTPGASDMPGRLSFFTTADGAATLLRRWSIGQEGNLTQDSSNGGNLTITKPSTGLLLGAASLHADVTGLIGTSRLNIVHDSSGSVIAHAMLLGINNNSEGVTLRLLKSRATDGSADVVVQDGDIIGNLSFMGADGAAFKNAAAITIKVDGTPGSSDMPGRIELRTTADGTATLATRLTIDNAGVLGFNTSGNESTGAGSALLGANSPAITVSAPYTWIKLKTSDASVVYMPVWK